MIKFKLERLFIEKTSLECTLGEKFLGGYLDITEKIQAKIVPQLVPVLSCMDSFHTSRPAAGPYSEPYGPDHKLPFSKLCFSTIPHLWLRFLSRISIYINVYTSFFLLRLNTSFVLSKRDLSQSGAN